MPNPILLFSDFLKIAVGFDVNGGVRFEWNVTPQVLVVLAGAFLIGWIIVKYVKHRPSR